MEIENLDKLKEYLNKSVVKKGRKTASVAKSESGASYFGAYVSSDTNLLDISSEQVALMRSVQNNDFGIRNIVTITEWSEEMSVSPINMKIMADYAARTQKSISYKLADTEGNIIFKTEDVIGEIPFYKKQNVILKKVAAPGEISENKSVLKEKDEKKVIETLKKFAVKGITRNFPTYDSASGYGSAALSEDGFVYYSGQYSSFEKRTNIHSEMGAVISAIMDGREKIARLGVVSSKYPDSPVQMCGCCRQFMAEMAAKLDFDPKIYCFSMDTDEYEVFSMEDYLPRLWSSKKWKE